MMDGSLFHHPIFSQRHLCGISVFQESGSRLVFSNKGDFFPDTQLRVLGAAGCSFSDIHSCVGWTQNIQKLEVFLDSDIPYGCLWFIIRQFEYSFIMC